MANGVLPGWLDSAHDSGYRHPEDGSMRLTATTTALWALALACAPAAAQRADDNPVTAAEDAFGSSIGGDDIGLYSATDVRGFSPIDAGNVRLEGLAVDRQAEFTSRLVAGNSVRVGLSAQNYPFPAPTGIVDYRLRKPGDARVLSVVAKADSYGASLLEADALLPLGEPLGLAAGVGLYRNAYFDGGEADVASMALAPRWRPGERVEILPFWSRIEIRDETASPVIVPAGASLPADIERGRFFGQPWAADDITRSNAGVIATATGERWTLRAGAFRSVAAPRRSFTNLLLDATPQGDAQLVVVANQAQRFASDSGELRLSRVQGGGVRQHRLHLSLRGRDQTRRYGGGDRIEFGTVRIGVPDFLPAPTPTFGAQTHERIRQWTGGAAYELQWRDRGEFGFGLQKTDYEKTRQTPAGLAPDSRDAPWLYNVNAAWHVSPRFALYGSHTRGLEESAVAPDTAVNRDEAPPAIRTQQSDLGLRLLLGGLRLNLGAFTVEKPYFGVDPSRRFGELGQVRHRGWEFSLAGEAAPGLNLVAGAVLLDARVDGEQVASGEIGTRPVGIPERTAFVVLDYRLPHHAAISLDAGVEHFGRAAANVANSFYVPAQTVLNVGARYRFRTSGPPVVLRLEATNLFDHYAWKVDSGGGLTYSAPRQLSAKLTVDL
jgi:iron complex outermembrane receptor protein